MTRSPGVRTKCTRSTEGKNKIARLWYCINSYPWEFPPPPPHHLDLGQCRYNTSSATIALTATSPTIILPLGSVRFLVFHARVLLAEDMLMIVEKLCAVCWWVRSIGQNYLIIIFHVAICGRFENRFDIWRFDLDGPNVPRDLKIWTRSNQMSNLFSYFLFDIQRFVRTNSTFLTRSGQYFFLAIVKKIWHLKIGQQTHSLTRQSSQLHGFHI